MVIDFHTHIFPEKIAAATIEGLEKKAGVRADTNGTVDGLLSSMQRAGVDTSVILPVVTSPRQFDKLNRYAYDINRQYENTGDRVPKLISFGGIHPDSEDYKGQLKLLKSMGFKGIKLHPDYQGVNFDDIRYMRIVEYASELNMIIIVHAGVDIGLPEPVRCTPKMSAKVLDEIQPAKLVLAHLGGWKMWDEVEEILVEKNVYLDTAFIQSYISKEQFCRIVENHGAERILFATDSPWSGQYQMVQWIQRCGLDTETTDAIFYKNAMRLLM